ncbi:MAG: hypothetical protein ABIL20_09265 [candidate division WOR-3 bacterium]
MLVMTQAPKIALQNYETIRLCNHPTIKLFNNSSKDYQGSGFNS